MKSMTAVVPEGTESVTLQIERKRKDEAKLSLREVMKTVAANRPLRLVIKDEAVIEDDRKANRKAKFCWVRSFPAYSEDQKWWREDRILSIANGTLFDGGVILDEREVSVSSDADGAVVLSVNANSGVIA